MQIFTREIVSKNLMVVYSFQVLELKKKNDKMVEENSQGDEV